MNLENENEPPEGGFKLFVFFVLRIVAAICGFGLLISEFIFNAPIDIRQWDTSSLICLIVFCFGLIIAPITALITIVAYIVIILSWAYVSFNIILYLGNNFGGWLALVGIIFSLFLPLIVINIGEKIKNIFPKNNL